MNDLVKTPIKQQIFADLCKHADNRGRVSLSPEAVAKRHGLNGHDLVKNLDQLRTQGLITFTWANDRVTKIRIRRGALNEAIIATGEPTSVERLSHAINYLPWENGYHVWDTAAVRTASGLTNSQITDALAVLRASGDLIQFGGGGRGKRISGVRWKNETAPETPAPQAIRVDPPAVRHEPTQITLPSTPHLDQYLSARRIAALAPEENPYLTVTFTRDPVAEEAAMLRDHLKRLLEAHR